MKLYFCWDHTSTNRFAPVMHHGRPPTKSINGGALRIASGPHELTDEEAEKIHAGQCFPRWLTEKYPPPEVTA